MSGKLRKPPKPLIVLILGGTTTIGRTLAQYLLIQAEDRASFVRIADRFSVNPPTTYLDKPFLALLNDPSSALEYKQVNLANVEKHVEIFTPPSTWNEKETGWQGFDVVYDMTGETASDKPELLQISHTYQLALTLATSVSSLKGPLKPKGYVRLTFPFYEMKSPPSSSAGYAESFELRPDGVRGRWWHETLRGLGQIPGLNLGVIRCGAWYGRGSWGGEIVPRLVVGQVYKYLKQEMKFLYKWMDEAELSTANKPDDAFSSDLRINTIHNVDVARALYLLSLYLLSTPRETVTLQAGSAIPFSFTPPQTSTFSMGSSKRSGMSDKWKTIQSVVPEKDKVIIPLFNVVDEGDATQEKVAKAVAKVWKVDYGFLNSTVATLVQQFAKTDFAEMVEDVNEMHVEAWSKMLAASNPPIDSTPITPFLDEHAFKKHAICLDGSKAKRILGFKPAIPSIQVEELQAIVKDFQDDGLWPKLE